MEKTRARISILSELLAFPTINQKDWNTKFLGEKDVQEGDLISLSSAPESKWYLSWVCEIDRYEHASRYLLESIEDGKLCWWENVGISVYDRKRVSERPKWKWSDKQFAFQDRWQRVCNKNDAYIVLPKMAVFGEDNSVTLGVRIRFNWSDFTDLKTFSNWKKVTIKLMDAYYKDCEKKYKEHEDANKEISR